MTPDFHHTSSRGMSGRAVQPGRQVGASDSDLVDSLASALAEARRALDALAGSLTANRISRRNDAYEAFSCRY
jgi:hypothetical protein